MPQALLTLGLAATRLNVSVTMFLRTASAAGVVATLTIDDIPHFAEADVDLVRERLNGRQSSSAAAGASVPAVNVS